MKYGNKIGVVILAALALGFFSCDNIEKHRRISPEQIQANKLQAFAKYSEIGEFGGYGAEGLALVKQTQTNEEGKKKNFYGFINENYEECIPCIYQSIEPFEGDVTFVQLANKYALINKQGDIVKHLKYTHVSSFYDDDGTVCAYAYAFVDENPTLDDQQCLINRKGEELCPFYDNIDLWDEAGLCVIKKNGKYGFMDKSFREVIRCKYDKAWGFQYIDEERPINGFFCKTPIACVGMNEKYGCIDIHENKIIPIKYDSDYLWGTLYFREGRACVTRNGKYGYLDEKGEEVIECQYDDIDGYFCRGRDHVKKNGEWYYIDIWGNRVN